MNRSELDVIQAQHRAVAIAADNSRQALRRLRVLARKQEPGVGAEIAIMVEVHRRNQAALTESRKRVAAAMRLYKATH